MLLKATHFLSFFLSLWCASSPSERLLSAPAGTADTSLEPNQHTSTWRLLSLLLPLLLLLLLLPFTIFPGQEGNPPCGPQTMSPGAKSRGDTLRGRGESGEEAEKMK